MPPILELDRVEVWFADGPHVLHAVSLTVRAGEHWALLGANGAGKSTLLAVAGAQRFPSAGSVTVLGHQLGRVDVRELRRMIGTVDVRLRMPAELVVADYVATGVSQTVQPVQAPSSATRDRVVELLELLGISAIAARQISVCSQGERARARLARALVGDPGLLLLDEPAAGLDLPGRGDLLYSVEAISESHPQLASIVVAHHLEELPATTTHVALLRGGRIVASGGVLLLEDSAALSQCFGRPVEAFSAAGKWFAIAARPHTP